MLKRFRVAKKESRLISGLYMAEGETAGQGEKFCHWSQLVLLLNTWMCTYGVNTCAGTPYRERIHVLRPYVHYFRSLVFSCIFIKLLTGLF